MSNECPTVREQLEAALAEAGIQDTKGVKVVLASSGETILIVSEDNPALDRREVVSKVTPVSSASAGTSF